MRNARSLQIPLCAADAGEAKKPTKQPRASKRINMPQASNMMEAVACAKLIDLPLVAHLTIHWAFTDVGDDPTGSSSPSSVRDSTSGRVGTVFPSPEYGHVSACQAGRERWCIAICSSTCRSNSVLARGCAKSRRRSTVSSIGTSD